MIIRWLSDLKEACRVYDVAFVAYAKAEISAEAVKHKAVMDDAMRAIKTRVGEAMKQLGETHSMVRRDNQEVLVYFAAWCSLGSMEGVCRRGPRQDA